MPFIDLIFRCPLCGEDAMRGDEARVARCTSCGREYEHLPETDRTVVRQGEGSAREMDTEGLVRRVGELEAKARSAGQGTGAGSVPIEASAVARFAIEENPVRYRGALMGFVEKRGPRKSGTLRVEGDRLEFVEVAGESHEWRLLDLRAVQTASTAVQISPLAGGVVAFKLLDDSPRRWEELLRERLRAVWRKAGRGEIVEFQPRIRTT